MHSNRAFSNAMISGDLDTEAASNFPDQKPNFLQSVLRSFGKQNSRTGSRSRTNTGSGHIDVGTSPVAYAACLSSLSFFIHDGLVCTDEADDPYNAICFFHPANHTPTEQWEFTGPIVGAVRFMTSFANSPPKIIHLANSSIALLCFDQYTVGLKACKVICSNSLEACLRDLYNVFTLFFNDLKFVRKICRDDNADVALVRFKNTLAHIWTKLLSLVGPCKLLHPVAHIPHFIANDDIENQLYQFFACIIAILTNFSRDTFGCLLSYESQLVQSTFDVSLTRTLMLSSSLIRSMPQTAHVLPSSARLPKSAFVRYAFASRSQLLDSRIKLRNQLKQLPPAAQLFLGRAGPSAVDAAFSTRPTQHEQQPEWMSPQASAGQDGDGHGTPNSAIMSRYFDFAWDMAGSTLGGRQSTNLDGSFSAAAYSHGQDNNQENGDHWESRSSSMSSVAVDLNRVYATSYSPLVDGGIRNRSASNDFLINNWPTANFDQLWADNSSRFAGRSPRRHRPGSTAIPEVGTSDSTPFGQLSSRLPRVLRRDEDDDDDYPRQRQFFSSEDRAFGNFEPNSAFSPSTPSKASGAIAEAVRHAASRLSVVDTNTRKDTDNSEPKAATFLSTPFSANGFLDSGHSSYQGGDTTSLAGEDHDEHESNAGEEPATADMTMNSETNGRTTADSGAPPLAGDPSASSISAVLEDADNNGIVETVLYVQSHGPLSLIALIPNSPNVVKDENLRRAYNILLPILADVCTLLMHLESESAKSAQSEAVVVSFEPSRQRLHRLGLCRACTNDIRFDTQLFGIQQLFAKDPNIKDLQLSDWTSHVRVTREVPRSEDAENISDSMAPYHCQKSTKTPGNHSFIKVRRNGCASSLIMLPSAE